LTALALLSGPVFAASPSWVSYNAKAHTATLTIIAAYTNTGGGFNFNGDSTGKMVVTIPLGTKVTVKFTNKGSLPHSVLVTTWADRMAASSFAMPFKGRHHPTPPPVALRQAGVQRSPSLPTRPAPTHWCVRCPVMPPPACGTP
jgi:hypothetical protein